MKKPSAAALIPVCLLAILFIASQLLHVPFRSPDARQDHILEAMQQEYQQTYDPSLGRIPRERLLKAREIRNQRFVTNPDLYTAVSGLTWTERGPSNIGGRTRALCFDLNDAPAYKKVWAGGVSGGLWYTNDITAVAPVWVKVNDLFENLAISCIAQSGSNPQTMYFGTGEGWFNIDAVQGLGIWKTSNGGSTWSQLPSTNNSLFYYVQKIIVDQAGNVYACTRSGGLQKSADGGVSWTKVLGVGANGGISDRAADIEMAPNGDLYCSLGIGPTGKIYRSVNQGTTWTDISPGNLTASRIELATCPSNSDTVYALMQGASSSDVYSIQRYKVSSNIWYEGTVPTIIDQGSYSVFTRSQAWYDLIAAVDPNKSASLYIGGVDALRSDDAGITWTQMTTWSLFAAPAFTSSQNVHADHHAIVYAPGSSSRAIWGTDGGVYYTSNANVPATSKPDWVSKNTGYNVTQYYSGALHPTAANFFIGGTQDNGSHKFLNSGINSVAQVSGGDGGFCHIDQDNPAVQITSYVYNNYYVSTNEGGFFTSYFKNYSGQFINPSDYDNLNNILYAGNDPNTFFRWKDPATNGTDEVVNVEAFNYGKVTHVAVSPLTNNRVFFGLSTGAVVMVDNAHTGLDLYGVEIRPANYRTVSCIAIDPSNENHLLVTYSNYGTAHVYETFNALQANPTWTSVNGNLPDIPVRWVLFDPRNPDWALLATELGIWSTDNLDGASTDWDPTNNGLANVRVDMLDYRNTDRTLLAATHGRGIFTTVIPDVSTPDINFTGALTAGTEATASTTSCRGYKDYTVSLAIANAPAGDATVTLQVDAGNTALRGRDFEFTTNGDFSNPVSSLIFSSGIKSTKPITVRIYDDAEVEPAEQFKFSYTLSGTTNARPGSGPQKHSVTIYDNDFAPTGASISSYTVGQESYYLGDNTDGTGSGQPFNAKLKSNRSQFVYQVAELTAAGMVAGNLTAVQFNFGYKNSIRPYTNLQVKMATTTNDYLVDGGVYAVPVTTYGSYASFSPVSGWNTLSLNTPFVWDGVSNIVVEICYDNTTAAADDRADLVVGYSDGGASSQGSMFWQNNLNCSGSYTSVTYYSSGIKPQIRFTSQVQGTTIATVLNTSGTVYLGPFSEVYFYGESGKILGAVKNLTAHDYGCTQLVIDRAGTGALPFWNNNTANYLMSKTFRVLPANNNPSGSYQITLYYDQTEVAGWQQATGQDFANISLVKVSGAVSSVTPATPGGGGTVEVATPVRSSFGVHSSLTYTFNTGFSGFGAGIAGTSLPVRLLEFSGTLRQNNVLLNWSTASEFQSKEFVMERSYDGVSFTPIGRVAAGGNSSVKRQYTFLDRDPAVEMQFYRLRQVDIDGNEELSKTITVRRNLPPDAFVKLLGNPVWNNQLAILFLRMPKGKCDLLVMDAGGKLMFRREVDQRGLTQLHLDLTPYHLPAGTYHLRLSGEQWQYQQPFIKY